MNNEQFRRLLGQNNASSTSTTTSSKQNATTPSSLGSRMRSSIPMTPRNVTGSSSSIDFARQLRDANAPPAKKFKSTAVPKGTKLATGYVDRARLREDAAEDDAARRIMALEEMVKLGQMEPEAFEKVRDEIIGGNINNVHLVKGLDKRLLERARRGEDVFSTPQKDSDLEEPKDEAGIDEALDEIEAKEIIPTVRTKQVDDNAEALTGRKRTRDDILREMKEARQNAVEQAATKQPVLGSRFRKVAEKLQPGTSRLEIDEKGREVLVIVDEHGNIKRKVKKSKALKAISPTDSAPSKGTMVTDKSMAPLGADVVIPERNQPIEQLEDEDIFAGVGTDYDPLAGLEESSSESGLDSGEDANKQHDSNDMPPPSLPRGSRNYFNEKASPKTDSVSNPALDPEFLAAIRKAATVADRIDKSRNAEDNEETLRKLARRKEMLQAHDRDEDDLDLGFGSSRFDDQEEGEERSVKLSKWHDAKDDKKGHGESSKRKRGGKTRKGGDKNSASDVLAVLDRRAKG